MKLMNDREEKLKIARIAYKSLKKVIEKIEKKHDVGIFPWDGPIWVGDTWFSREEIEGELD